MRLHAFHLGLVVLLFTVQPVFAESIIVATDDWCPYHCDTDDGPEGYAVDLMREIFKAADIDVVYRVMGWERAVEEALEGHVGAVLGASRQWGKGFVFPEEEMAIDFFGFYVQAEDSWQFKGVGSLIGKRIGIPRGYRLDPEFEAFLNAHKNELEVYRAGREAPAEKNLRLLTTGRVDVILDDVRVVRHVAQSMAVQGLIKYAGDFGFNDKLYIAFSPVNSRSTYYAKLFDEGIGKLRASGRLKEILQAYGLTDWK